MTSVQTCTKTRNYVRTRVQHNIATKTIQAYDDMETFQLNAVNEKQNSRCVRKEI